MSFIDRLADATARQASMLCVGLDPDPSRFPEVVRGPVLDFCKEIVDATAETGSAIFRRVAAKVAERIDSAVR